MVEGVVNPWSLEATDLVVSQPVSRDHVSDPASQVSVGRRLRDVAVTYMRWWSWQYWLH